MNWKLIVVGGIVFYLVTFILSFVTGPLIHNGLLKPDYQAHAEFWRPELNQDPPDMAGLMPRWITTGILGGFIYAGLYGCCRKALNGPGWKKGLSFGIGLALLQVATNLGWSGIFNLPDKLWAVWAAEGFLYFGLGCAALGWVAQKVAPEG